MIMDNVIYLLIRKDSKKLVLATDSLLTMSFLIAYDLEDYNNNCYEIAKIRNKDKNNKILIREKEIIRLDYLWCRKVVNLIRNIIFNENFSIEISHYHISYYDTENETLYDRILNNKNIITKFISLDIVYIIVSIRNSLNSLITTKIQKIKYVKEH